MKRLLIPAAAALLLTSSLTAQETVFRSTLPAPILFSGEQAEETPSIDPLYAFTSHEFTSCGSSGRLGPDTASCLQSYSTEWAGEAELFQITDGIQHWTVPETGEYRIVAEGASGALYDTPSGHGGYGARIGGTFMLSQGQVVKVVVGQKGTSYRSSTRGKNPSGGGGTFVYLDGPPASPLVVAGGGAGVNKNFGVGAHGQATNEAGLASAATSGGIFQAGLPGQFVGIGHGSWINSTNRQCSGGGAGWLSKGADNHWESALTDEPTKTAVDSPCGEIPAGGKDIASDEPFAGGYYAHATDTNHGGFGGGGGAGNGGEGGGGGFTGGAGTWNYQNHGGGGGSFNGGTDQDNETGVNIGHGSVTITRL